MNIKSKQIHILRNPKTKLSKIQLVILSFSFQTESACHMGNSMMPIIKPDALVCIDLH